MFQFSCRGTGVVCFSFFFWLRVLDKAEYLAFESTLNSSFVSYLVVDLLFYQSVVRSTESNAACRSTMLSNKLS